MQTPICDFVRQYAQEKPLRLHMPGHKGVSFLGAEPFDITEIDGADVLYHAKGIIRQSEENAARLFSAERTVYSAEGSSLGIRAMLYLALLDAKAQGRTSLILAGRNAHKTFLTACALLDLPIRWIYGEELLACHITAESLEAELSAMDELPAAVYLTSPDYLGNRVDIAGLSRVCHRYGALLLVDNAHGAYLQFLPQSEHPIALGADACCDSAHKTLPVLTGGAYLHISKNAPKLFSERAEQAMALFASTSPSYLILCSLDEANRYLAEDYRRELKDFLPHVSALRERLKEQGYFLTGDEPLKLTLCPKQYGYRGSELAQLLFRQGIVCEFSDADYLVLMLTPQLGHAGLMRLEAALCAAPRREAILELPPKLPRPRRVLRARQALLSGAKELELSACRGKILAELNVSCPPAVPIAVCGEEIDEDVLACLRYYGVQSCRVVEL